MFLGNSRPHSSVHEHPVRCAPAPEPAPAWAVVPLKSEPDLIMATVLSRHGHVAVHRTQLNAASMPSKQCFHFTINALPIQSPRPGHPYNSTVPRHSVLCKYSFTAIAAPAFTCPQGRVMHIHIRTFPSMGHGFAHPAFWLKSR